MWTLKLQEKTRMLDIDIVSVSVQMTEYHRTFLTTSNRPFGSFDRLRHAQGVETFEAGVDLTRGTNRTEL